MNITEYLSKKPKSFLIAIGTLLVVSIGVIDYLTGYEISFSIFYILPIALIAWFVGRLPAVFISVLSAITWLLADLYSGHSYPHYAIPFWNTIMRFGIFLMVTYFLTFIKKLYDELEIRVRERTAQLAKSNEASIKVNRAYKTLSVCTQGMVRATDESVLLHDICRVIVEAGGYLMALVGYAEQDEQKTVRAVAQMGYEEDFIKTVDLTWADTELGHGPIGTAIRTRTPSIFQNIANESKITSWREAALKRGYASAIGLPLIVNSDLLGALAIYSVKPYAFDEEEIKLLTELADDLAYGIMTLRTRAKYKRAEQEKEKLSHQNELILNSAGEGILGLDLQGNHTFVNPAAARILGYEVEELIGRYSHTIWHHTRADGSPYPQEKCAIYTSHRDGAVHTKDDEVFWRKDGTSFPVRYTSSPILEDGKIIGAVVTFRDITERKQAEKAMKESEEKFRKLASSANDAIIMMDNEGKFFYWNEALERIFGYSSIEILGKEVHTFLAPERYYEDYKKGFARFRETGKGLVIGKPLELVAVKKDGTEFPIELSVSALQFKGKWISIGILRDITERKRAEETLRETRDYLENLFNYANAPIIVWDPSFRITRFNQAFEHLTGYIAHEVIGKELHTLFPEESKGESLHKIERTLSGEYWESVEIPIFCKGGDIRIALWNSANIYTEDGKTLLATIAQGQDITERKQAEEAQRRSKKELLIRNQIANIFLTVADEEMYGGALQVIMEALESEYGVFGYIDEEGALVVPSMTRKVFWEKCNVPQKNIVFPRDTWGHSTWCEAIGKKKCFYSNKPSKVPDGHIPISRHISMPIVHQDASIGLLQVANKETVYDDKDIQLLQTIADHIAPILNARLQRDRHERYRKWSEEELKKYHEHLEELVKQRTAELEDANLELQALNKELELRRHEAEDAKRQAEAATKAKSDFLANMSHELRTPLNAIIGFSDMMSQGMTGKLTEQQLDYLGDIRESGELLLSLINDILDLSKVEAGKMELELSEFDLKELIEGSLVMFKEKALKHNIKVKYEVDERIGSITADERRLKQVIFNLLSNAVKFTPDGGSVSVRARFLEVEKMRSYEDMKRQDTQLLNFLTSADFIEITVEDTGIGIRPEDFDKIFQPFQQLEYILNKKYEGTGLGLTLCKRIVELHHGRIWVESEMGKGTKFTFVIPIRQ